jgi:hypothetical protein
MHARLHPLAALLRLALPSPAERIRSDLINDQTSAFRKGANNAALPARPGFHRKSAACPQFFSAPWLIHCLRVSICSGVMGATVA